MRGFFGKVILIVSKIILILTFLCVFAYVIKHVNSGGQRLGIFTRPLKEFSILPQLVVDVFKSTNLLGKSTVPDPDFTSVNDLTYDLFILGANLENRYFIFKLSNLKNDSILHTWRIDKEKIRGTLVGSVVPILLEDRSIIINIVESFNLYRLDKSSNLTWHNTDYRFHHSFNLDHNGDIWACAQKTEKLYNDKVSFCDDYITKIDIDNGTTLFSKSVKDILLSNELEFLVFGVTNRDRFDDLLDPFHLNDIEPVLKDGPYWKRGDLFLSVRNRSLILLYRPSTNEILRVIQGPFFAQHDIDIQSDTTISFFNNNRSFFFPDNLDYTKYDDGTELFYNSNRVLNKTSQVLLYSFNDSTFYPLYQNQFLNNKIFSKTQGLHQVLANGDLFLESTDEGKVFIFNNSQLVYRSKLPYSWSRIYENIDFLKN